jgi:hypothetical protein
MAIIKITELPVATSPVSSSDVLPVVQNGITKQAAINELGYLPPGSGAVSRTIQDKLRETVSIQDFGGVGDAVADDTAAVLAAIAATPEYGTILLNNGIFRITQPIHITKPINIIGTGFDSGFYLSLDTNTNGIRYGNVELLSQTLSLFHTTWEDFAIYGLQNSCKNALVLTGLIQCAFKNIHVQAGTASGGYGVYASALQSCRPVQFNSNQFYQRYPVPCYLPANGFRVAKLDGTTGVAVDCDFNLVADGGMGYGIYMQGMQSSTLSGLSEGNSTFALAMSNCTFNNIRNFYVEAGDNATEIVDDNGQGNVFGPGIFHSGDEISIFLQSCDSCVVDGVNINVLNIDSACVDTKIGNISCFGQVGSNIIDAGTNTIQINGNAYGYQNKNIVGQFSDFNSIISNGNLERWIDANTPAGSWSASSATMARSTSVVKFGTSSLNVTTSAAYPASTVRLTIPFLPTAINGGRVTVSGWLRVPTSGGVDVGVYIVTDSGAQVRPVGTYSPNDQWRRVSFSTTVNFTGSNTSLQIWFATPSGTGTFFLDGWSAVPGNAGGSALYTPNANEFVRYTGQKSYTPGTINNGDQVSTTFTVLGAELGMAATVGPGVNVGDLIVSAAVTASSTVTVVVRNESGGSVTLGASTWYVSALNINA